MITEQEVHLLLASIVESSDDAIISNDLNGIVTSWNRSATRIFGYTEDEMIGRPIWILAAPGRENEMPEILDRIRGGERVDHYETNRRAKSGAILHVSLTVSPIYDSARRIIGASKIARDITEKKLAEKALIEQAEKLARSNADLQEFAHVTSHDLQEPLRTISTFSELLRRRYAGRLDERADQYIDLLISAATRMSELIRDVLSYSSVVRSGRLTQSRIPSKLMVEWAIENLRTSIDESGATIEFGDLPVVTVDKAAMAQVFQNLISNALKYRAPGVAPRIRVDAQQIGSEIVFSVRDNGIGIPPAYHATIFGLFQRLHAAGYEGTGIGLAFCKRIVEKHGGRIWVESQVGEGSVFRFTIPQSEVTSAG